MPTSGQRLQRTSSSDSSKYYREDDGRGRRSASTPGINGFDGPIIRRNSPTAARVRSRSPSVRHGHSKSRDPAQQQDALRRKLSKSCHRSKSCTSIKVEDQRKRGSRSVSERLLESKNPRHQKEVEVVDKQSRSANRESSRLPKRSRTYTMGQNKSTSPNITTSPNISKSSSHSSGGGSSSSGSSSSSRAKRRETVYRGSSTSRTVLGIARFATAARPTMPASLDAGSGHNCDHVSNATPASAISSSPSERTKRIMRELGSAWRKTTNALQDEDCASKQSDMIKQFAKEVELLATILQRH
jgi:hypothetical protein